MKILPHTAPYPFTLASLLGVSEHVVVHAVGVVCGLCLRGREWGEGQTLSHTDTDRVRMCMSGSVRQCGVCGLDVLLFISSF